MSVSVLLVEDHDANRAVIKRRLERRGFAIDEACDGFQAVERFAAARPDCVIMDLSMPNMSGMEALQRIRETPGASAVPVVALTAHAMETMRRKCEEVGFNAFLTKPINFEELVQCITALTARAP